MDESLERTLQAFVDHLREELGSGLVSVCLFGSQVDVRASDRDVDLLIVWEDAPKRRWTRGDRIRAAARSADPAFADWLAPIVLTPDEVRRFKPYYLGILTRHRLLHDRDGFFADVLARLRARLDELGARRLTDPDGYEYWDLAPNYRPGDEVVV